MLDVCTSSTTVVTLKLYMITIFCCFTCVLSLFFKKSHFFIFKILYLKLHKDFNQNSYQVKYGYRTNDFLHAIHLVAAL